MYKVVIADDEYIIRKGVCRDIKWAKYGFEVVAEVADGRNAIEVVRKLKPELLITDIRMPDMDGLEVLRQIKGEKMSTQVIILSAYDLFTYAQQAITYGAVGYLLKPVELAELDLVLEKVNENICNKKKILSDQIQLEREADTIEKVRQYLLEHYAEQITLKELSDRFYMSNTYLSSKFKNRTGSSFVDYLTEVRIKKAKELLLYSDRKIPEIASLVGYDDYTYFGKVFKKNTGYTPLEYRCTFE